MKTCRTMGRHTVELQTLGNVVLGFATDIGPRVLFLGSTKKPGFNLFGLVPDFSAETAEGTWKIVGGHRLWTAPESRPRSYSLDNMPVRIEAKRKSVTIHGNPEEKNGIAKRLSFTGIGPDILEVAQTITNTGRWPIQAACWGLSVMKQNGFAVIPLIPHKVDRDGLLPDRRLTLWPYTDLSDHRLLFTNEYLFLRQDPKTDASIKIGTPPYPSWTAYCTDGMALVKTFSPVDAQYPDFGCSMEIYANAHFLELETLSPLRELAPGASLTHVERWHVLETGTLSPKPEVIRKKLEPLFSGEKA